MVTDSLGKPVDDAALRFGAGTEASATATAVTCIHCQCRLVTACSP